MDLESKFKKYFKWFKLVFKTDTLKNFFLDFEFWTKVPTIRPKKNKPVFQVT